MVQPFGNISQLTDPGVSPAISGINTGINSLLALKKGREGNQQSMLNQLLGGAFDIQAANIAADAKRDAKQLELDLLGQGADALGAVFFPNQPSATEDLEFTIPPQEKTGADIVLPARGATGETKIFSELIPGADESGLGVAPAQEDPLELSVVKQGTESQPPRVSSDNLQRAIQYLMVTGNEASAIKLGQQFGLTPESALKLSGLEREERIGAATEGATISKKQSDAKKAQIDAEAAELGIDPKRTENTIYNNFKNIAAPTTENQAIVDPFSPSTKLIGLKHNPNLDAAMAETAVLYGTDPKAVISARTDNRKDGGVVTDLVGTMKEMEGLIGPGIQAQIKRNVETGDFVIDITGNAVNARLKQKARSLAARLTRAARAMGERGVVTEPDVEKIRELFPDMLGSKERFEAAVGEAAITLLSPVLKDAASLANGPAWNPGNKLYKEIFNEDFKAFDLASLDVQRGDTSGGAAQVELGAGFIGDTKIPASFLKGSRQEVKQRLEALQRSDPASFQAVIQAIGATSGQ